jgi:hypothetical protein
MCALHLCSCTEVDTGVGERLSYGPFHGVRFYSQPGAQHLALLLSGDGGWGSPLVARGCICRSADAGLDDTVCPSAEAREFVGGLHGAHFIGVPGITRSSHHLNRWWPDFESAWRQLAAPGPGVSAP